MVNEAETRVGFSYFVLDISRGHATLELAVSVCPSIPLSKILLNWVQFPHYGPCQTVRYCFAWYPALLKLGSEEEKKVFREMIT